MNEKLKSKVRYEIRTLEKAFDYLESSDGCPTCYDELDYDVHKIVDVATREDIEEKLSILREELKKLEAIDQWATEAQEKK